MLSKWHVHAVDYAREANEHKHLSIKLVWDEDVKRGKEWADELGVPFEADLQKVLTNPEIDAVIVDTPTNLHKEIIIACAKHGKHIFTEKVLAFTVQDCDDIFAAIEEADVQFMISLPRLTEDYYVYAQDIVNQGVLGRLTTIRCRVAHNGAVPTEESAHGWLPKHFFNREQCGGGALIDLGAHPIYLTNRLAGEASSVMAYLQPTLNDEVDDNAVVLVQYESGALGTLETGFLSSGSPFQLELYGTEGTLLIEDRDIRLKIGKQGEWLTPTELPTQLLTPMEQWVQAIEEGVSSTITKEDARNLTLINEAAAISHSEGRRVILKDIKEKR